MLQKKRSTVCHSPRGIPPPQATFCPYCYANRKGVASYPGHRYYSGSPKPLPIYHEYIMKRVTPTAPSKKGAWSCPDPTFLKTFPTIAEYCCDDRWDDGKPRTVCTLRVGFDSSYVQLALNDSEGKQGLYTSAPSLQEALTLMEEILASGKAQWRRWKK